MLANILAQHSQIYVTPTSGIVDMLVQVRNNWDRNDAFQAAERKQSEETKERVMRAMLQALLGRVGNLLGGVCELLFCRSMFHPTAQPL